MGETGPEAPSPGRGAAPAGNPSALTAGTATITIVPNPQPTGSASSILGAASSGGSGGYKIAADGSPTELWNSRDELVDALAFERIAGKQNLGASTRNKRRIFAIRGSREYYDLGQAHAHQV